jgi:ETC complex I subunit conserved region
MLRVAPGVRPLQEVDATMVARIFKPAKTAMQSGSARTAEWRLEFEPERPRTTEPLMGYTSSSDMRSQVRLSFHSKDDAIAYATRNGIAYRVEEPKEKALRRISYSDNFKFNRIVSWTH